MGDDVSYFFPREKETVSLQLLRHLGVSVSFSCVSVSVLSEDRLLLCCHFLQPLCCWMHKSVKRLLVLERPNVSAGIKINIPDLTSSLSLTTMSSKPSSNYSKDLKVAQITNTSIIKRYSIKKRCT